MSTEKFDFVKTEELIQEIWRREKCFEKQNELIKGRPEYTFYDGPPFATGLPHYGHILSGTIKDTVTRFFIQQGYSVTRKFGWDCHGLPVEYEIDKKLKISTRKDVLDMGIAQYNKECKSIVLKYTAEWKKIVCRMGRWIDFRNGYRTMDISFMESIWYVFSRIAKQKRVYRGFRVMSYSTACSTPLSNFEANQNYKEKNDPQVIVAFKLRKPLNGRNVSLLIWTTTAWTLPSNLGVSVHPDFEYAVIELNGEFFLILESRRNCYNVFESAKVLEKMKGSEVIGLYYDPPFTLFLEQFRNCFRVLSNEHIESETGTGIMHMAPAFGEEDYNVFLKEGLLREDEEIPCIIDEKGVFTETEFKGLYFLDANKPVMNALGRKLLWRGVITHRYPYCWRSDTPLIYKIVPNWFLKISDLQKKLYELNQQIHWVPEPVKNKFGNWLKNARDWSISRNRFWGTPIPIWASPDFKILLCVSSINELEEKGFRLKDGKREKVRITDLHREFIDDILIEKDGTILHRIDEVFDCWFESGSMPLAQDHWPFSQCKSRRVDDMFDHLSLGIKEPCVADFIAEGLDQTRGWFYTLHVISTLLFDRPAFKNIIVNGIVLASDGKKMSKRLKNYPDSMDIANLYGVDSLRFYLISSPVVEAENLRFSEKGVKEVFKNLMINWYNTLNFYIESSSKEEVKNEETVLDAWILSQVNELVKKIKAKMEKYELSNILSHALSFIDDLSNWYVRMNRARIRDGEYGALRSALSCFSVLMVSFTPFFSEYSYQVVNGNKSLSEKNFKSVHYEMFPVIKNVEKNNFDKTKKIIEGIRTLRENKKISLKTPLLEAVIIGETDFNEEIIKDECNLLDIRTDDEQNYTFDVKIKPNFTEIKKRTDEKDIAAKIKTIKMLNNTNEINYDLISKDEILVEKEIIVKEKNKVAKNFGGFSLILNTELNRDLIEKKTAREFFAFLQKLRKKLGLKAEDNVKIYLGENKLRDIILKNYEVEFIEENIGTELLGEETYSFEEKDILVKVFKNLKD